MVTITDSKIQNFPVEIEIDIGDAKVTLKEKNTCFEIPSLYSKRIIREVQWDNGQYKKRWRWLWGLSK